MLRFLRLLPLSLLAAYCLTACSDRDEKANAFFAETQQLIQQAGAERDAAARLEQLQQAQAKAGMLKQAFATAQGIVKRKSRAGAFRAIAMTLPR